MRVLDLFSGIGGFSLGLERAGMKTVAFCEIDPFCRKVLEKHWPDVPCYEDVRTLTAERLRADGIAPDVICGGFPCQDISSAGKGAGIDGDRSGLWSEYARLIGEIRPRYVVVENVAALLGRGLDRVLGNLATIGFDAEWHCIPASAVGAPHQRDRIWIVAHAGGQQHEGRCHANQGTVAAQLSKAALAYPARVQPGRQEQRPVGQRVGQGGEPITWADTDEYPRLARWLSDAVESERRRNLGGGVVGQDGMALAEHGRCEGRDAQGAGPGAVVPSGWWLAEPDVGRVAHGVPARVDRLRSLGNAVVPQIPEIIGRAIMTHFNEAKS